MSKQAKFVSSLTPLLTKQVQLVVSPKASPLVQSPGLHHTITSALSKKTQIAHSSLQDIMSLKNEKQQRNYGLSAENLNASPDRIPKNTETKKEFDMTDDIRPGRNWHYNIRTNEMEFVDENW